MKWEYKIIYFAATKWTSTGLPNDIGEHFDSLGDDEWELVRIEPILRPSVFAGSYTSGLAAFFKRPKASGA